MTHNKCETRLFIVRDYNEPQNHDILTTLPWYFMLSSLEGEYLVIVVVFVWGFRKVDGEGEGKGVVVVVFIVCGFVSCGVVLEFVW